MKIILRIFKYVIVTVILLISTFIGVLQIPYVQNKLITKIFTIINKNNTFEIDFGHFYIKRLTNIEVNDITITSKNNIISKAKIKKITLNINPINIILDKKVTIENVELKNTKIFLDSIKKDKIPTPTPQHSQITNFSILQLFTLSFRNIKLTNCEIIKTKDKNRESTIINCDIKEANINTKNINIKINSLSINNKLISIKSFSGSITYYLMSDTICGNNIHLSSNCANFDGDIYISNVYNLTHKSKLLNCDYDFNIKNSLFQIDQIKKLTKMNLDYLPKEISINGIIKKKNNNISIKNLDINDKTKSSTINLNINNVSDKNKLRYTLNITNSKLIIQNIIKLLKNEYASTILNDTKDDIEIEAKGDSEKSTCKVKFIYNNSPFTIDTEFTTSINTLFSKKIKDAISNFNIKINTGNYKFKYIKNLTTNKILLNCNYDNKTKTIISTITIDDIMIKNIKINKISYNCKIDKNNINGDFSLLSNKISISANNTHSFLNSTSYIKGSSTIKNLLFNNVDLSKITSNFYINVLKDKNKYTFNSSINDINIHMSQGKITSKDIITEGIYENNLLNIKSSSDILDFEIKNLNPKELFNDIKSIILNVLEVKKINQMNKNNEYTTTAKFNIKKSNLFEFILKDYIYTNDISIDLLISNKSGNFKNDIIVTTDTLIFLNNKINSLKIKLLNNANKNNILNTNLITNFKYNDKSITNVLKTTLTNNKLNVNNLTNVKTISTKLKEDIINSNFTLDIKNKYEIYLKLDDIKNYIRFFDNKIVTTGSLNYNLKEIIIKRLSINNPNDKINFIKINGKYNLKTPTNSDELKINIDNIDLKNLNLLNIKNINCTFKNNTTITKNKIHTNIHLKNLFIDNLNYNNIDISSNITRYDTNNKKTINLYIKQHNNTFEFLNIYSRFTLPDYNNIFIKLKINSFDLRLIKPLVEDVIDIKNGKFIGEYTINKNNNEVLFNGNGDITNLTLKILKLGCELENITGGIYSFNSNDINIYSINTYQNGTECGNYDCKIVFEKLTNPVIDLTGKFYNCNIINKEENKDIFYGKLIGNGELNMKYNNNKLSINTNPKFNSGNFYVKCATNQSDEIQITTSKLDIFKEIYKASTPKKIKTTISIDTNFNDNIDFYLLINKFNTLKINGIGNIIVNIDNDFKIEGNYKITKGSYKFNIYKIFERTFDIKSGSINFNNNIQNSTLNIIATSGPYNVNINNENCNVFLNETLTGNILSPNITYDIQFTDNKIRKNIKKDIKEFFSILLFNNANNNELINASNNFLNSTITKAINKIDPNLNLDSKCDLAKTLLSQKYEKLNFNLSYKLKNKFKFEKTFDFSKTSNLYKNIYFNYNSNLHKNNMIHNISIFDTDTKNNLLYDDAKNIISYSLFKNFEI